MQYLSNPWSYLNSDRAHHSSTTEKIIGRSDFLSRENEWLDKLSSLQFNSEEKLHAKCLTSTFIMHTYSRVHSR